MKTIQEIRAEFKTRLKEVSKANDKLSSKSTMSEIRMVANKLGYCEALKWVME